MSFYNICCISLYLNQKKRAMNAQQILESKGIESNEAASIVYEKLDLQVRELYNVENHALHLWDSYAIGDANKDDLLKDALSNTIPRQSYNSIDELLDDMTKELERFASLWQVFDAGSLINWAELSRLLTDGGDRSSITRSRIPAVHQKKISKLISLIYDWRQEF